VKDYWSFVAVHETFVQKTCGEVLRCERGGLYRRDRGKLLVINPPEKWDFSALFEKIGPFPAHLIRSFGFFSIPATLVSYATDKCYVAESDWKPSKDGAYALRAAARHGMTAQALTTPEERESLPGLVSEWAEWAKGRHDMVVKGHYLRMIQDPRVNFTVFRDNTQKLVGAMGWVSEGAEAAICFTKHLQGAWWWPKYIWTYQLQEVFRQGVTFINCGDTADRLKQSVGLVPRKQRRLYYSKRGLYRPT